MNNLTQNQFTLPYNAYAAFDAYSLKSLMLQRLSQGGVFTDQIYEGSNFNSFLDVIAYSYNVLLYYLNKTSSESMFSQAQLYENMNRIVKVLNYNPIGFQTSILSFSAVGLDTLPAGTYTIPRYSYFSVNSINFTFTQDYTFVKTSANQELLQDFMDSAVLYQGTMIEYPIYLATGAPFEQFSLAAVSQDNTNELIDHSNIHVYVYDETQKWVEWKRVTNLYLETPESNAFECRYNENQRYVIKFGNNVNGRQLNPGFLVAVYYLKSDGVQGEVGANNLNNNKLTLYTTTQFDTIFGNVKQNTKYITQTEADQVLFVNSKPSTQFTPNENVLSIRENAPNAFKSQYRLVTVQDFENYIRTNFGNLINDVKVVNNWDYTGDYLAYLYGLGLKAPSTDSRVLFNQVMFADSCDFNNVYIHVIPKIRSADSTQVANNFLPVGLKNLITNSLQNIKLTTAELIVMDPVYIAVGLGVASSDELNNKLLTPGIINETKLIIGRDATSKFSENEIRIQVANILINYFKDLKLGIIIDFDSITSAILGIEGVTTINTVRTYSDQVINKTGLSLLVYNPVYSEPEEDISIVTQSQKLSYFKTPYLVNPDTIANQIEVVTAATRGTSIREY